MRSNISINQDPQRSDSIKSLVVSFSFFVILYLLLIFLKFATSIAEPVEDVIEIDQTPEELTMHRFETSAKKGGGSGQPVNAPKSDAFQPQTEKILTDPNSTSSQSNRRGNSNHSNAEHSETNGPSTTDVSTNPFGSGGTGGGTQGGRGSGFGKDEGGGSGPGPGGGEKERIRLNNPNTDGIGGNLDAKISLKLTVNAEGDVIKAENIVSKTTTTNQTVINQVISNVKGTVKYNKKPGAAPEIVFLTVRLLSK